MYPLIALTSFLVAGLTFFSGFGLGTLLLPLFTLFFPVPVAVAATAVVHLMNNISKVVLVGKYAKRAIILRFGIPAVFTAFSARFSIASLLSTATYSHLADAYMRSPVSYKCRLPLPATSCV